MELYQILSIMITFRIILHLRMGGGGSYAVEEGVLYFINRHLSKFATNSDFIIPISLLPNVVTIRYFKLLILLQR